ncbi:EthD domain-containing protein [Gordonia bronchialis]|uniref:EthD domain-containing protein n=1 Tax=Gordonia bronchialis TaxID=2054 RepID=UPI00226FC850|nr:EthD domain-containing protein [Gordonia bronchialis]
MSTKIIAALWDSEVDLTSDTVAAALADAGASRVQVNVSDGAVAGAMRISHLDPPIEAVVGVWTDRVEDVVSALAAMAGRVAALRVTERAPLDPRLPADGTRIDALANIAFLRRPADLSREEWLRIWLEEHTTVAIETQATFGYYQNVVEAPLTPDAPHVDAIVEELFPMAAITDIHAFYGSGGDQAELESRMTRMLDSVQRFGADKNLDVIPTSRYARQARSGARPLAT